MISIADICFSNGSVLWLNANWELLLFQFRMPKLIAAIGAGGSLGIAGLLMQNIFKNDLAGPDVLGISRGASLMVGLSILAGVGVSGLFLSAVVGALLYLLFLLWISRFLASNISLLLVGIMLGFVLSAILSTLEVFSNAEALKSFVVWGMGSFSKVAPDQIYLLVVLIPVVILLSLLIANPLDVLLLGNQKAGLLGINAQKITIYAIIISGLAVGIITALCGPIAFVGLLAPHICKWLLKTYKHHILIPAVFLMGALIAVLADFLSSGIFRQVLLPLNATLSILAAPVIFFLIIKKAH